MLLPDTIIMTPVMPCEDTETGICLTYDWYGRTGYWLTINGHPDTMTEVTACTRGTRDTVCLVPPLTDDTTTWWLITPSLVHDVNLGS